MVRLNLVDPAALADQHLIAEYNEILMFLGYVRKHPSLRGIPASYRLGEGHVSFFKDKLLYVQRRHGLLKEEMRMRGFVPVKEVDLTGFPSSLRGDWAPDAAAVGVIKGRLREKLLLKPNYYRYRGERRPVSFFLGLIDQAGAAPS
ncbi:pyrimidine dimer DNA glycosylase/endonuclease V [Candidatus Woesearchaeota archaeon]|nr:pyrimidine dimer DNA glycosylase/endonuclease V [Candidatus Woesearchaeota archaeon]